MLRTLLLTLLLISTHSFAAECTDEDALHTLALTGYMEARGEKDVEAGMRGAMEVVLVRLYSGRFGDSICEVVFQPSNHPIDRPAACAFSFTCDSSKPIIARNQKLYFVALNVATELLDAGMEYSITRFANHYLRCDVGRKWTRNMKFLVKIGSHCFYSDDPIM